MEEIDIALRTHQEIYRSCLENNVTFVTYRLPDSREITTLVQYSKLPEKADNIENMLDFRGFVFAPFRNSAGFPVILVEPDVVISGESNNDDLLKILKEKKTEKYRENPAANGQPEVDRNEFVSQVERIKKDIKDNRLGKIVLSRIHVEQRPLDFHPELFFSQLTEKYPDAFVYLLYIPGIGCWCGASPEPLVKIKGNRVETISLAGTRKYSSDDVETEWNSEEQEIVTSYIEDVLGRFKIHDYSKEGPYTQRAGNLLHLKTEFSFQLEDLKDDVSLFINELHPTPSVCGFPKNEALKYLQNLEPHNREYYSGFLGPVNINGKIDFFVNLRCMKVFSTKLALFLGAGITSASDAASEWEETNSKKMTLLSVIKNMEDQL